MIACLHELFMIRLYAQSPFRNAQQQEKAHNNDVISLSIAGIAATA